MQQKAEGFRGTVLSAEAVFPAGVVQWQNTSFPSWICGFDSRRLLYIGEVSYKIKKAVDKDFNLWFNIGVAR